MTLCGVYVDNKDTFDAKGAIKCLIDITIDVSQI